MTLKELYLKNSLLPKRYYENIPLSPSKQDVDTFRELNDVRNDALNFVNSGNNLLIYSNNVGCGKTTWAAKILKSYLDLLGGKMSCAGTPALFINVSNFLNEKKLAISNEQLKRQVTDVENKILKSNLVIFDDLGVKGLSEYDSMNLYYWVDYRTSNMKSSIYTSNLTPDQLKNVLDERIYSRVVKYSLLEEIKDGDSRGIN